jgi:hypothetical protein
VRGRGPSARGPPVPGTCCSGRTRRRSGCKPNFVPANDILGSRIFIENLIGSDGLGSPPLLHVSAECESGTSAGKLIWSCAGRKVRLMSYRLFKKERYNDITNVTVWTMLRKCLHLRVYELSIVEGVERWIVCTPLITNVFVTLATQ